MLRITKVTDKVKFYYSISNRLRVLIDDNVIHVHYSDGQYGKSTRLKTPNVFAYSEVETDSKTVTPTTYMYSELEICFV